MWNDPRNIIKRKPMHKVEQPKVTQPLVVNPETQQVKMTSQFKDQAEKLTNTTVVDREGKPLTIPNISSIDTTEIESFTDFWTSSGNYTNTSYETSRISTYALYDTLDNYVPECSITLNTYANEVLGTGFVTDPIIINCTDDDCKQFIEKTLEKNDFYKYLSSYVYSLLKYGDLGFLFHLNIDGTFNFKDIQFSAIHPKDFSVAMINDIEFSYNADSALAPISTLLQDTDNKRFARCSCTNKNIKKNDKKKVVCSNCDIQKYENINAWEFSHWCIPHLDYRPYGRSILDQLRTLADQKSTMEVLLALSRQSKVDRLVLEVETTQNNPTVAMQQISKTAATYKNMIFGGSGATAVNRSNPLGLTEILTVPKDMIKISKLSQSFDVANTQDVEYFRDQLISLTSVPKSQFMADQVTDRGGTLASQDVKFSRALVKPSNAIDEGLQDLCCKIALLGGYDLTKIGLQVKLNKPVYVAKEMLDTYEDIANRAANILNRAGVQLGTPDYTQKFNDLALKLGLPQDYIDILSSNTSETKTPEVPNKTESIHRVIEEMVEDKLDDLLKIPFTKSLKESINGKSNSKKKVI